MCPETGYRFKCFFGEKTSAVPTVTFFSFRLFKLWCAQGLRKWLDEKGFGFITTDDGGEDVSGPFPATNSNLERRRRGVANDAVVDLCAALVSTTGNCIIHLNSPAFPPAGNQDKAGLSAWSVFRSVARPGLEESLLGAHGMAARTEVPSNSDISWSSRCVSSPALPSRAFQLAEDLLFPPLRVQPSTGGASRPRPWIGAQMQGPILRRAGQA